MSIPPHPAHQSETLSLVRQQQGAESVFDTSDGTLGAHEIPYPHAPLKIGSMAPHTALVGSSGAGKTLFQKSWIQSILCDPRFGLRYRAFLYDPKREFFPFLRSIGIPSSQVIVTHPFDVRSAAWDLGADFTEPSQIEELTEMIVPKKDDQSGNSAFFETTARIIIQDVIYGLRDVVGSRWDLHDLVEVCSSRELIRQVLEKTRSGRDTLTSFFKTQDARLSGNVYASLVSSIRPFQTLAAVWKHSAYSFSLERWGAGSGIILMGADPRRETTLQRLNQLMFQRASQVVLSRDEENPLDLTWFFLDEAREAGKLNGLRQLLTESRSKGGRVVLGFQDIDGMIELYGERGAAEIVGLCANRIFLHLDNPSTRDWVSEFFAEREEAIDDYSESTTISSSGTSESTSTSWRVGMKRNVLPVELHDLPLASAEAGIAGFYATTWRGLVYDDGRPRAERGSFFVDPEWLKSELFTLEAPPGQDQKGFIGRDPTQQNRIPLSLTDCQRLGLSSLEESTT